MINYPKVKKIEGIEYIICSDGVYIPLRQFKEENKENEFIFKKETFNIIVKRGLGVTRNIKCIKLGGINNG